MCRVYYVTSPKPSSIKYFYFSESLQKKQLESKARILKKLQEAKEIQEVITKNKKLPKKFRINNELIEIDYSFRTKLEELSDEEAIEPVSYTHLRAHETRHD